MIDLNNPVATPFRVNWGTDPVTEYHYKTDVFTAADGSEQRRPMNRYPEVRVRYETCAMTAAHADRIDGMLPMLMTSAVAVRDFRMNGAGRVSADGSSFIIRTWSASWAVGVRVVIEDDDGLQEHTALVTGADPASRTVSLSAPCPEAMRGKAAKIGSAVVASLDDEMGSVRHTADVEVWDVSATSFRGLDPIGGAPLTAFPFSHGSEDGVRITARRSVHGLDYGVGRRSEVLGYASMTSGFRTYQVETYQLSQTSKEALVSFYCGCRGRHKSFTAPKMDPSARFRFASDILVVTHRSGDVSSATLNVIQVLH